MSDLIFTLSVRALLYDHAGALLLLQRSNSSRTNPGRWEVPGGKIDEGESFDFALRREVKEETGLTISLLHPAGTAEQIVTPYRVVHLFLTADIIEGEVTISREHQAFQWTHREDISRLDLTDWFKTYYSEYLSRRMNV